MTLLLFTGLLLTGACGVLVLRAVTMSATRRRQTLAQIAAYGFRGVTPQQRASSRTLRDILNVVAGSVGRIVVSRVSAARQRELRTLLQSAGFYRTSVIAFLGYRVLGAAAGPLVVLLIASGGGGIRTLVLALWLGAMGWFAPALVVKRRARERIAQVDREVPELVDLLVTTVEAGVGFAAALQLASRHIHGALGDELRLALREQSMGLTTEQALRNVATRVDSPAMRAFIQALLQGESLGVSIGKVLRDLAAEMRTRRRQAAEERAQKTPTKIVFPLVALILPALFIVTLGPMLMSIFRMFHSV